MLLQAAQHKLVPKEQIFLQGNSFITLSARTAVIAIQLLCVRLVMSCDGVTVPGFRRVGHTDYLACCAADSHSHRDRLQAADEARATTAPCTDDSSSAPNSRLSQQDGAPAAEKSAVDSNSNSSMLAQKLVDAIHGGGSQEATAYHSVECPLSNMREVKRLIDAGVDMDKCE